MKKLFHLKEHGTSVPTEIRAGLTTFFAMAYIIFVNPVFLSATGMDVDGAMIATCLGAAIGCLMTALLSNKPFAMALMEQKAHRFLGLKPFRSLRLFLCRTFGGHFIPPPAYFGSVAFGFRQSG